ncbi:MAG: TonB family protein [Thermodesulfovibrionales bacterium]|nr:TonB family protein [Thermodesulfovibrionales bacterium]
MLTIKRFFAYSLLLHIALLIAALSFVPPVKGKKGGEFFASLVSPEEISAPASLISPIPDVRPVQPVRPKTFESSPPSPSLSPDIPSPQSPSVLASGRGTEGRSEIKETMQKPDVPMPSIRERLFDRSIIGELAKREVKKAEREERTFAFDMKELRYSGYLRRLKERIESIWIYPPDAAARGIYGDLIIKFTIKKNGRLGPVELIRTSGHKNLDDAALRALRDAEPFWPLPDEWDMEAYTIEGHFIYTIYGYYVR